MVHVLENTLQEPTVQVYLILKEVEQIHIYSSDERHFSKQTRVSA